MGAHMKLSKRMIRSFLVFDRNYYRVQKLKGAFIVQMMKSLEVGYWVDEEPYELSDAFPAAQVIISVFFFVCVCVCFVLFSVTGKKLEGLSLPVLPPPPPPPPRPLVPERHFQSLFNLFIIVSIIIYFFISFHLTPFHFCSNEAIFYRSGVNEYNYSQSYQIDQINGFL